jgi:hypothetical protein
MSETETAAPQETPLPDYSHATYESLDPPKTEEPNSFCSDKIGLDEAAAELTQTRAERNIVVERAFADPEDREKIAPGNYQVSAEYAADTLKAAREFEANFAQAEFAAELAKEVDQFRQAAQPTEQPQHAEAQHPVEQPQPETAPPEPTELDQLLAAVPAEQRQRIVHGLQQYVGQMQNGYSVAQQPARRGREFRSRQSRSCDCERLSSPSGDWPRANPRCGGDPAKAEPAGISAFGRACSAGPNGECGSPSGAACVCPAGSPTAAGPAGRAGASIRGLQTRARCASSGHPEFARGSEGSLRDSQEHGISKQELMQLYENNPVMRHSAFQIMMHDAAQYRLAKKAVTQAKVTPIAKVQRPGTSGEAAFDRSELSSLQREFNLNPSSKLGAQLLAARRGAR